MSSVLLYARDPGSANVIIPVINKLELYNEFSISVFAKDYAVTRMEKASIKTIAIQLNSEKEAFYFLEEQSPDLIITGSSLDDFTERFLWKAAQLLDIPSYAIMDQWILLGIRFSKYDYSGIEEYRENPTHDYYPRRILVMDDIAKRRLVEDNVPENKIAVTGQPHFDDVRRNFEQAELKTKSDVKVIVFASEPKIKDGEVSHLGYSERSIYEKLIDSIISLSEEYNFDYNVIIRPHPREDPNSWTNDLEEDTVFLDAETDSFTLMKNADLVCGMSSMFLVEAAICKVPIISCLIGLKSESPFVFDQIGVYNSVRSHEELYSRLKEVLVDGKSTDIKIDFMRDATDKTVKYIMEDAKDAHIGN